MTFPTLVAIEAESVAELCARANIAQPIAALSQPEGRAPMNHTEYVHTLLSQRCYTEAVQYLAHGLRKPVAIRWAYLSVLPMEELGAPTEVLKALEIAEEWLEAQGSPEPDRLRDLREEAAEVAQELAYQTPSSWVAAAVSHSEPPAECPKPELYEPMSAHESAAAILLAAGSGGETIVEDHDDQYLRYLQVFLSKGIHLAAGGDGLVEREYLEAYFPDDPTNGRVKIRANDLEELIEMTMENPSEVGGARLLPEGEVPGQPGSGSGSGGGSDV